MIQLKKILLINPNTLKVPYPVPPVGISILASLLKKDFNVAVFDGAFQGSHGIRRTIREFQPDWVGIGIRNIDNALMNGTEFYADSILDDFIHPIREVTKVPIILGGSGFTIFARELMDMMGAEFGVVGEGESVFPRLILALRDGQDPHSIPGVVTRNKPGSGAAQRDGYIDPVEIPFSRIDTHLDYSPYALKSHYPIQMKRGCVRKCVYCTYPAVEGIKLRERMVKTVVHEIEETVRRLGPVGVEFVDSTFNDPPELALGVCREIIRRQLKLRLRTMGINPRHISSDLLALMKEAGFGQIDVTPDSASDPVLMGLQKGFSREDLEKGAKLIREHRMPTMWFFIFGGPGETAATIDDTFDFIDRFIDPEDLVHITEGLRIYPNTGLHKLAVREGMMGPRDSLLRPRFYVSPELGRHRLDEMISEKITSRLNCLRGIETTPTPEMMKAALKIRSEQNLDEPMFRTLLRLRRAGFEKK